MHRVNPRHRRAAILRALAYSVTLSLSVITTIILLLAALGYRLDGGSKIVLSGLLLVDSKPEDAQVYINNQLKDEAVPSRFVLEAGNYNLQLRRNGYHSWQKQIKLVGSDVEQVNYPLLVPQKLTARNLVQLPATTTVSQSLDRKRLLLAATGEPQLQLIDLSPTEPKITALPLPEAFSREAGKIGSVVVVEWALNNKQVLLNHTLASGSTELLSLDVTNPDRAINITKLYPEQPISDVHFVGNKTNQIYGLVGGSLQRMNLEEREASQILATVRSYVPFGDETIAFSRLSNDQKTVESGVWRSNRLVVVDRVAISDSTDILQYGSYDDHEYLAVSRSDSQKIILYRDVFDVPLLSYHSPFISLAFSQPQKLDFSSSGQFLLVQNSTAGLSYNFEALVTHKFSFNFTPSRHLKWIDGEHLLALTADNAGFLLDFDGTNQMPLLSVPSGDTLYFSNNYRHLYRINRSTPEHLEVTSLVVGKP